MGGNSRAAEHAGQNADQGDAHLDRGQKALRILGQSPSGGGTGDAFALQHRESRSADGDQGQLAHREQTVQENEQKDKKDFEAGCHDKLL